MTAQRVTAVLVVLMSLALDAATAARPAAESWPGRNGRIAFVRLSRPCVFKHGSDYVGLVCEYAIWTANVDGSGEERLTRGIDAFEPAWSPDGRKIAYLQYVGSKPLMQIWVMNADGSGKHRLRIERPRSYFEGQDREAVPRWSPDGKTILVGGAEFTRSKRRSGSRWRRTGAAIAVPTNGGAPRTLFLARGLAVVDPQFSPTRKLVAYIGSGQQASKLYVARANGSRPRAVAAAESHFDWSPDGRRLVFWQRVHEYGIPNTDLHVVNVDGSGLRRLTPYRADIDTSGETPSWSPDGNSIIYKSGTRFDKNGMPNPTGTIVDDHFAVVDVDGNNLHLVGPQKKDCSMGPSCACASRTRRPGSRANGRRHRSAEPTAAVRECIDKAQQSIRAIDEEIAARCDAG